MRPGRGIRSFVAAVFAAAHLFASGLPSADEALRRAFPDGRAQRETVFLTREQQREAAEASGEPVSSRLVTRFVIRKSHEIVGWAYLDTHRVRTLPETLLVMLDAGGRVLRVEAVRFREPREYLPPASWFDQFRGGVLDDELRLGRRIRPITGATLSARAAVAAIRRVLAVHSVLSGRGSAR